MAIMNLSSDGLYFIIQQEGIKLTAYPDGKGYSIGYGAQTYEDGKKVQKNDKITQERAEQLLNFHAGKAATAVNKYLTATVGQNQFDSLVSFTYNVGTEAFRTSTLLKVINANPLDLERIESEFKRWIYSDGAIVPALVNRRQQEAYMYGQPSYTIKPNFAVFIVIGLIIIYWFKKRRL